MPTDKPVSQEDEYFLKADMEKIKTLRGKLDQSRKEENEQRHLQAHWMKCPKCDTENCCSSSLLFSISRGEIRWGIHASGTQSHEKYSLGSVYFCSLYILY